MNRYERELQAIDKSMLDHAKAIEDAYERERQEDRTLSDEEQGDVSKHVRALEDLKIERKAAEEGLSTLKEVQDISKSLGPAISSVSVTSEPQDPHRLMQAMRSQTIGEVFVGSKGYKDAVNMYREAGRLPQGFSTGAIGGEFKGTLLEGAGGGGGAIAATVPMVVPGVVDKLFQPLTFADLILGGQTAVSSLRYVVEGTATSGAAGVAEGGLKPQSTLGLTTTDEPIKKIATSLKVSDEMLEDAPAVQSYINGRLTLFVRIEEERQLLRGTSGGNEVQGLLTSRSVPVFAGGTAVATGGNKAVQIFKAMNGLRGSAFLEPDFIVMHPTDWQDIRLLADSAGQLFGGGPFYGPYGGPQGPANATGQVQGPLDAIWNKPVYVTATIGSGTALVGNTTSAQVWRRGGLSVEATNANEDDFLRNLIAIRAEERLGLAVYRPTGFVEVRLS